MEDQQPDPGDLTTDPDRADTVDAGAEAAPPRRRRWPFGRRNAEPPVLTVKPPTEESADAEAPKKPVGKSRRTRTRVAAADPGPVDSGPVEPGPVEPDEEAAEEAAGVSDDDADEERREVDESTGSDAEGSGTEGSDTEDAEAKEPAPEPVLVPHRPVGKRLIAAGVVAGALFVGAAAFAGSQLQPYLTDRAAVDTKLDIARTATEAVTTLWTYTPDDMETLPDRSSRYLTGDFATEYRRYIDAIVATNKQAQVTNTTEVMGAAVESLSPTEATAIVYTNSVSTSPVSKNIPSLRYLSYRLTLERQDANWMITRMNAVTKLDLTPQI